MFLDHGSAPAPGFIVRQPELARTLEAIANGGGDAFYRGDLARRMVAAVQSGGGIWELEDLQRYKVLERAPSRFTYRGARNYDGFAAIFRRADVGAEPANPRALSARLARSGRSAPT